MIKKLLFISSTLIIGKEVYLSVVDKILHTTLLLAILFVVCLWTGYKYKQEDDYIYNRISIGCAIAWGIFAVFTVFYAPKYFESAEPVSGGIGYIMVKVFDKDIVYISNSRDEYNITAFDYYLADQGDGRAALLEYFKKEVSPQVECVGEGDSMICYISGKDNEMAGVSVMKKKGYDILRVEGTKAFKQKNLFGGYYRGKDIYTQK